MLTRKDYRTLAGIINAARWRWQADDKACEAVDAIATRLADQYERENPRFNRERFLSACGMEIPA